MPWAVPLRDEAPTAHHPGPIPNQIICPASKKFTLRCTFRIQNDQSVPGKDSEASKERGMLGNPTTCLSIQLLVDLMRDSRWPSILHATEIHFF